MKKLLLIIMLLGVGYSQCIEMGGWDGYNVLDVVLLANCIMSESAGDPCSDSWMCDINGDGAINVLDIVNLVNCVLAGNCGS